MKVLQATWITVLVVAHSLGYAVEVSFPIHAFGVKNSQILIDVEQETMIPSLKGEPLTRDVLKAIAPYPDSEKTEILIDSLLQQKDRLTLGSTTLYFYLAVNLAFDRIYRSYLLNQGYSERTVSEKQTVENWRRQLDGMPQYEQDRTLANLRTLVAVAPISGQKLRLRVFSSRHSFDQAARSIGLHSASAYWDPSKNVLGIYFDARVFEWYRDRTGRRGQEVSLTATQARNYVTRQVIDLLAHELIHFVHHATGQLVNRPFIAEGVASLIQSNIAFREEMSRIAAQQARRGLPLIPTNRPCLALLRSSPPMFSSSLSRFQKGINAASGVSLQRLLLATDSNFYSQSPSDLATAYDTSLAFAMFVSAMSEKDFGATVFPLLKSKIIRSKLDIKSLESSFKKWAAERAEQWQPGNEIDQEFDATMRLTSACMNNRDYPAALAGSWRMLFLRPTDARGYVYAGDVYFRLDVPFFAFDLYARANQLATAQVDNQSVKTLVLTRLGDAFELMGDMGEALSRYKAVSDTALDSSPELVVPVLRSRLKAAFYEKALREGYASHWRSLYLLNSYVDEFQTGGCESAAKRQFSELLSAAGSLGVAEYLGVLSSQLDRVRAQMRTDSEAADLDELWRRRTIACPELNRIVP